MKRSILAIVISIVLILSLAVWTIACKQEDNINNPYNFTTNTEEPIETPTEETPTEETPTEETPTEESPTEESPTEETPTEETPVEETPVEDLTPWSPWID